MTVTLMPLENLIPICSCAALTITTLGIFAKQNRKSGWVRNRPNLAEALAELYSDLAIVTPAAQPVADAMRSPVTIEEAIGFSAQMLKLRGALGTSTPVEATAKVQERELVLR